MDNDFSRVGQVQIVSKESTKRTSFETPWMGKVILDPRVCQKLVLQWQRGQRYIKSSVTYKYEGAAPTQGLQALSGVQTGYEIERFPVQDAARFFGVLPTSESRHRLSASNHTFCWLVL